MRIEKGTQRFKTLALVLMLPHEKVEARKLGRNETSQLIDGDSLSI